MPSSIPFLPLLAELDYERLIGNLGMPAVFMLAVVYVLVTHAPKLVTAHLEFLEAVKLHSEQVTNLQGQNTDTLETLSRLMADQQDPHGDPRFRDHLFSNVRTNEALLRYADALEALAQQTPQASAIMPHLKSVRQILQRDG